MNLVFSNLISSSFDTTAAKVMITHCHVWRNKPIKCLINIYRMSWKMSWIWRKFKIYPKALAATVTFCITQRNLFNNCEVLLVIYQHFTVSVSSERLRVPLGCLILHFYSPITQRCRFSIVCDDEARREAAAHSDAETVFELSPLPSVAGCN